MADVVVLKSGSRKCVVAQGDAADEPWVWELESGESSEWNEDALRKRLQELVDYNLDREAAHRARAVSPPLPLPTAALDCDKDDPDPAFVIEPIALHKKEQAI